MGRHSLATKRRRPPIGVAALIAPAALLFAVGSDVPSPAETVREAEPIAAPVETQQSPENAVPCCVELVAAPPIAPPFIVDQPDATPPPGEVFAASRLRIVDRSLPAGIAPERGLQVKTILTSRAITEAFPEISNIGGVRPDSLRWHPNGLALDVMIPNPTSAEGIALGNEIVWYVLRNAKRFGMQDAIWRGVYYTPDGAQGSGHGHFDHVHITTIGGGYPDGDEVYLR
ncbi:hypothetical protein [Mycolicibacterium holsaticum]|uniref:ARB-07466-like C-terminal domain-containing protein n=1 Tax=Mycolicibacterium holsaticum TaxID=152142 RepID=A0A1E3RJF5_9MYCO|nr:hypothetical protein [Mycolicibacterium holsaticum]ODQ89960.1 hypothetical protein BHQ17_17725 [Mycolicibacterium holsaticum]QZA12235.1 hypothetical protein K3U96_24385 [Mycolicibacterium holsaticum DSM 44478 = JCM 12374]UNC10279.1 hypothetical protein H5U41_02415 [Mycolicibacterium holsaticum DSM 44478 = JCM 12374]